MCIYWAIAHPNLLTLRKLCLMRDWKGEGMVYFEQKRHEFKGLECDMNNGYWHAENNFRRIKKIKYYGCFRVHLFPRSLMGVFAMDL